MIEFRSGLFNLDALDEQLVDQFGGGERIVLRRRDDIRRRLPGPSTLSLPPGFQIRVPERGLPISRGQVQCRPGGDLLTLDDVAHPPPTARPWIRERSLRFVFRQSPASALELIGMEVEWAPESRAGRLGEHARDVVEGRDPVEPEMAPAGIDRSVHES